MPSASTPDTPLPTHPPLQPPVELQPAMYDYPAPSYPSAPPSVWDSPAASTSRPRGHSRHNSTSSVPTPANTGRRGSTKDPEALQAALERTKSARKRRTNSTASATLADDDLDDHDGPEDSASALRQRQEDARLIRCDAEQQRRNELGKGYDRLRAALNRGDERLSKARVVERATARVVQLRDQNQRMQEELMRKQEIINELNRANEQLMLEASGAAPLLVSSPHSASSPSSGRPGSSSHTSVSAFGVGQTGHPHDRSSSLPTPPHTHTGLQYAGESNPEFGIPAHSTFKQQDPFAYAPFEGANDDQHFYPQVGPPVSAGGPEFFVPRDAPPGVGLNPLSLPGHPRSESPRSYEHGQPAFGLPAGADDQQWLPVEGVHPWTNATSSGLPGTFAQPSHGFTASPTREGGLNELSEVPATTYPAW